jgi:hypothetical protein
MSRFSNNKISVSVAGFDRECEKCGLEIELVLDCGYAGLGAGVIGLAARCAGDADRTEQ